MHAKSKPRATDSLGTGTDGDAWWGFEGWGLGWAGMGMGEVG